MKYVQVAGDDLQREFHLARSQPRHLAPQPKAPIISPSRRLRRRCRLSALRSTRNRDVPALAAGRPFPTCLDRLSNRLTKILSETRKLNPAR